MKFKLMVSLSCCLMFVAPALAGDKKSTEWQPAPLNQPAEKGRASLKRNACLNCHSIRGVGGCLAPVFDGLGAYRSADFIVGRISTNEADRKKFSAAYQQTELMEHVRVSPDQARSIAAYLLTIEKPKSITATGHSAEGTDAEERPAGSAFTPGAATDDSRAGKLLFRKHNCAVCHSIADAGGRVAPALDGIGARRSRAFIAGRMRSGAMEIFETPAVGKASRISMPPQMLTAKEISQITDYLLTLPARK